MNLRPATKADEAVLRELWEQFESELPAPPEDVETWEQEWQDVAADIDGRGAVYLAENDDGVLGGARAKMIEGGVWYVVFAYVRPDARRRGVLKALLRELVREGRERGSSRVTLDVLAVNEVAVAVWRRLGFQDDKYYLATTVDDLESRLARGRHRPLGRRALRPDRRLGPRSSEWSPSTSRGSGIRSRRSWSRRTTAGRASTTSSPAATRRRCGASAGSCPPPWARSCSRSASRAGRSSATSSGTAAASPTSTSRCPSTTGRCRLVTSSPSPPTRRSRSA